MRKTTLVQVPGFNPEHMPTWYDDALCTQVDPDLFYPEKGGSTREAKKTCLACPVRARHLGGSGECLDYALAHQERYGIWGGVAERERRGMINRQQQRIAS